MLSVYFLAKPLWWILPWVLQTIGYFGILRKTQLKKITAFIPLLAEWQLSGILFRRRRTFYRPFVIALVLCLAAAYLGPYEGMGRVFMLIAFVIYGVFLIRLYWRLAKAMGRGSLFAVGTIILPPLFLLIAGVGKARYVPLEFKPEKQRSRAATITRRIAFVTISVLEVLVIVTGVGLLAVRQTPPAIMVGSMLEDVYNSTKSVTGTGETVSREEALGAKADALKNAKGTREHFCEDHSQDKNVVVLAYVIGSNLEDKNGLASANIHQMIDATKKGDGLKFVLEAGGCERWFTSGISDSSYGRYEISGGKLKEIEALPSDTCMSEEKTLEEFLTWGKKAYSADRHMLVLWDHGGGFAQGYGLDDLNSRDSSTGTLSVSELVSAIDKSRLKFDVIGFDACLMQDIEIATALEPYADYLLASEEIEGGFGWFYTSAFGKLAENPGMSSRGFGREMIACYDPYNMAINEGEPDKKATLSFVDLPLAAAAYDRLEGILDKSTEEMKDDPAAYADMATAANSAYSFEQDIQIDLINFLNILKKADYDDSICSDKEISEAVNMLRWSILYRNGASARGINGMSVALPYKSMYLYAGTSEQLGNMSFDSEKKAFDVMFSIMAAQQKKGAAKPEKEITSVTDIIMNMVADADYTKEDWYIEGFEDYDDTKAYVNIPLKETGGGYAIQLPEKAWKIVSDCQTAVYQKEGSDTRYLGNNQTAETDAKGNPMVTMDKNWVYIGDELVCYKAEPVMITDEGNVHTGKIRARLNGETDVTLNVEWDPVKDVGESPETGHITGYDDESILSFLNTKGSLDLEAGDTIQFLFDYYDESGKLIKTKPSKSKIKITKQSRLEVTRKPLEPCEIQFSGVLTDVYQRIMTTEQKEMKIQ